MAISPAAGNSLRTIARLMGRAAARFGLRRGELTVLIFFHGHALAHTLRPLVLARALRDRGYRVVLAGRGEHVVRVRQEGFDVRDVETLPQSRMDHFVARGDYAYYDEEWVDRCVRSERLLIGMVKPALVVHDMKPTAHLSARLEGVDDARITQAYNHPAYAHPIQLADAFAAEAGPFERYLAAHASQVQPQRSLFMLADVPQLHPVRREVPGYHYIGPLADAVPEPHTLDVLNSGWDTRLPLVYVTAGSSGRDPHHLDELLEAVRGKPYRLLITTANRWQPGDAHRAGMIGAPASVSLPDNVRVVPFLNGEWVLRRAEMLVGVVGIGAIYQALAQGRPVIGAPEHLDQEFHLNRVRDLGLGIKIDRRDFGAPRIVQAIEEVLRRREEFRRRCEPFRQHLAAARGGERAVDLVDAHFMQHDQDYSTAPGFLVSGDEFVRYLDATTPNGIDAGTIRRMLRRGAGRGLPHRWVGKGLYFDRCDSWNWLYENDTEFFRADYDASEARRQRFLRVQDDTVHARAEWQRFRLTYRLRLHPRAADGTQLLQPGERLRLFLPYPVHRAGHQSGVQLEAWRPGALVDCLAPDLGFVYGAEISVDSGEAPIEVGYTCSVSVRALAPSGSAAPPSLSDDERARCLELDERILRMPEVVSLRSRLGLSDLADDEARARAIYRELATTKRFRKTRDVTHHPRYATSAVLRSDGGHCTTLARAFTSLCRAEGIPTREVTGALLGYPVDDGTFELRSYGEPLFGHTWAEIWLDRHGWVPVEFHGIVIGAGAVTRRNVGDRQLRRQIEARTEPYLDYYFGHLDNHRVIGSPSVKTTPLVMGNVADPSPGQRPWTARTDLRFDCLLRAECV